MLIRDVMAAALVFSGLLPAFAAEPASRYTSLSGPACHTLQETFESCPALPGFGVVTSDNGNIS